MQWLKEKNQKKKNTMTYKLYIYMTTSVSRRLNILCIMFKIIALFIKNTVRPVICEGWHFTHMWKILA